MICCAGAHFIFEKNLLLNRFNLDRPLTRVTTRDNGQIIVNLKCLKTVVIFEFFIRSIGFVSDIIYLIPINKNQVVSGCSFFVDGCQTEIKNLFTQQFGTRFVIDEQVVFQFRCTTFEVLIVFVILRM